jgi:hypothetical protein
MSSVGGAPPQMGSQLRARVEQVPIQTNVQRLRRHPRPNVNTAM